MSSQPLIIQAQYDVLERVAQVFAEEAQAIEQMTAEVERVYAALRDGEWTGQAAERFFSEMGDDVLPACRRLSAGLDEAGHVTLNIRHVIQEAEIEAAGLFKEDGATPPADEGKGFLEHVGDFFSGVGAEAVDTVTGIGTAILHPVETAKGLWYGITHPGEMWEAIKQPYVEDWNNGRPWRAIGRGTLAVVTTLIGTKGADKAAAAAKASRAARVTADAAEVAARLKSPLRAADELATVGRGTRAETALSRYLAQESTHIAGAGDRVVLGAFAPDPSKGYLGYIGEATTHGGRYYSTPPGVWPKLHPPTPKVPTTYEGVLVNREFLRSQFEARVPRIELHGERIDEVLSSADRRYSYTAEEIHYLEQRAYEYGYTQQGNSWVLTGDWRASARGRMIGGTAGATLGQGAGVLEDAPDLP